VPALNRYGGAVDVQRAADFYARGWTLSQIGDELGIHWSTVSQQLQQVGVTMRTGGASRSSSLYRTDRGAS
jgi:hypothetical protein